MPTRADIRFGTAHLASGVLLIKAASDRIFRKLCACTHQKPSDILVREFAGPRALLLQRSPTIRERKQVESAQRSLGTFSKALARLGSSIVLQGYSLLGSTRPPFIFPTGTIFVLMDEKRIKDVVRSVSRLPLHSVRRIPRSQVLRLQVGAGREAATGTLIDRIARLPGVVAVTPDFSYYGPYQRTIQQPPTTPPTVRADSFLRRNHVDRAWEFGLGRNGIDVAVLDGNFYDHVDLVYRFDHGYDAADGDHDPRSPLSPPDVDVTDPLGYKHGTEMSGVIASHGTVNAESGTGVSPHSRIVPIRESDVSVDPMDNAQAFLDEWASEWILAMIEIFYSGAAAANASIILGINSQVIPSSWQDWLNWLTGRVFMSASAGNNPSSSQISYLALGFYVFAVGWADRESDQRLGSTGPGLDISVADGSWGALQPDGTVPRFGPRSGGSSVSAAIVSGVAALIQAQGNYHPVETSDILRWTAARSPNYEASAAGATGHSLEFGYGYLDAFAAVKQAHKGKGPVGRVRPIDFLGSRTVLVEQLGSNPWFWCLVPRTDAVGGYWGHWRPTAPFTDVSAGANAKGNGLVIGDFNGDGRDEIAVQQAGTRSNRFDIVRYNVSAGQWYRMGPSQDSTGSAFVWGPANPTISQVLGADLDGDGKVELVANRRGRVDLAEFSTSENRWRRFGPSMALLNLFDVRGLLHRRERVEDVEVTALSLHRWRRSSVGRDLILALARVRLEIVRQVSWIGLSTSRTVELQTCSLHQLTGSWVAQALDRWGATHLPMPFTKEVIVADVDGDGVDEAVLLYRDTPYRLTVLDISEPTASTTAEIGYVTVTTDWTWPGLPEELIAVDLEGTGSHELAYLESDDVWDRVRFLRWDPIHRSWSIGRTFQRKKLGNAAVGLQAGDFDGDGSDEIALLLEKPFGNRYLIFRYSGGSFVLAGEL